jgi:hypothetical protein
MPDVDMVLIVEPHTLTNPTPVPNMEFPRKLNACARAKYNAFSDLGTEGAQNFNSKRGTDL